MRQTVLPPLPPRQAQVYEAIKQYAAKGRSPSLRELAIRVNMSSTGTIRRHLRLLEEKGLLRPRRFKAVRDIHLADEPIAA